MNEHDATELAFKNGYKKGVMDVFEEIEKYLQPIEDIATEMKRQNQGCSEEYWRGKLSAFKQIHGFIDVELKKKYTEGMI